MSNLRTPLYDWHVAHKGRMVPFGGWDMPVQYSSILTEHLAVRNRCGWFDISHMARIMLKGPDAEALIQLIWTGDASALAPGRVRYGLVCNEQGGILDDILVTRFPDEWLLVVNASNRQKILAWLQFHAEGKSVTITDHTLEWAMIAVQGPTASLHVPSWMNEFSRMKYYTAAVTTGSDGPEIISRTGYTGEDGFEYIASPAKVLALIERLSSGDNPVVPCGLGCRDTLRLEAAMPLYGHELNESIDPITAGLAWAVKLQKPDFVGKAALVAKLADSARLHRVGLELEGRRAAREGARVLQNGVEIGSVTSGSFAPTLEKSIAMAYVPSSAADLGTSVDVDIRGTITPAKVVALPFYQRGR
ncbi:glycine cleavage system aminomethyltransferase GcvT [Tuwongella immobilis]|uniref:Aminomethyltransferase n=1 Tax=Tuwongella immobilis TaxID=692036 RepID=A0A6C2YLA0_9BACT|nr:glycine cleavage system aminomethyltransferase GcvT [Tuwongella immobilis]VIP02350.1 glycine cleavage system protein t : Aminomethyltransferase OS=Planctomyces maris DSM 8797 GN=gcvT PE=3 SV=1: GCV_T: GCV_T_C [Tuwongella immobilis]VTS01136.1 glycine cleavage system protein t : Aminomethyltransferase OS=Planctomyces maris DSM 8797 GN=gcvT PE=3 SV=1: GCV_T: GCV_T_C [Tuwongella immobilis]